MMTEEEIIELEKTYSESKIQHICVCWFRNTFPHVANLLFAVPNGGYRTPKTGAQMQYEGAVSGVSDLILLYPSVGKASLCLETKVPKRKGSSAGTQSKNQKAWQLLVEQYGSTYAVYHGLLEFVRIVCAYLNANPQPYINRILKTYAIYR